MKSLLPISLLLAAALMSSAVARPGHQSPAATQGVQTIDVTAKKYEFIPSTIRVKQGAKVELKITATDHAHGFQISEAPQGSKEKAGLVFSSPQKCHKIEKGETATLEFVAQTAGTYPFKWLRSLWAAPRRHEGAAGCRAVKVKSALRTCTGGVDTSHGRIARPWS